MPYGYASVPIGHKGEAFSSDHLWAESTNDIPATRHHVPANPLDHSAKADPDRDTAILATCCSGGYSMKAIGHHFGLSHSMVRSIVHNEPDSGFRIQRWPEWH